MVSEAGQAEISVWRIKDYPTKEEEDFSLILRNVMQPSEVSCKENQIQSFHLFPAFSSASLFA